MVGAKMSVEKKIRKGGLVKLNEMGESWANQLVRYSDETPAIWGKSKFTEADARAHRADIKKQIAEAEAAGEDTWSITMRDDGESRLPPTSTIVRIFPDRAYQVLRARAVGNWNYHRHPGQCLILDLETGREVYVSRDYVEAI
jgi:hypothetical protein